MVLFELLQDRRIGSEFNVKVAAARVAAFTYAETRLMEAQAGWLLTVPYPELKIELSYQLYEDAHHANDLRHRLPELGVFGGQIAPPSKTVEQFFNELTNTRDLVERLVGDYWILRPALVAAYRAYLDGTDAVADGPTVRILERALGDHLRISEAGDLLLNQLLQEPEAQQHALRWFEHLRDILAGAGGVTGETPAYRRLYFRDDGPGRRFIPDVPVRDERFHIGSYERREGRAATDVWDEVSFLKYMFMMVEGELEATEACGRTLFDFPDAPWEFRFVLARQLWDEARHAELSIQRFLELGGTFDLLPVRDTFPLYFGPTHNQDLGRRLAHLNQVVEGWVTDDFTMMVDICRQMGDERSVHLFEQLIADEWLHLKIGADWIPRLTANDPDYRREVLEYRLETERELYQSLAGAAQDARQIRLAQGQ